MDIKQFRGNIQNILCDFFVSHDDVETTDDIMELVEIQIAKAKNEAYDEAANRLENEANSASDFERVIWEAAANTVCSLKEVKQ